MAKIWCAEIECEHYSEDGCTADEINISAGHLECRTFKMSKEAEKIFNMLKDYFDGNARRSDNG